MSNANTIKALTKALADTYALYLKTQNFHWNVTGPQFPILHKLFESQYTELAEAVDTLAERIRSLDAKTPATFSLFNQLKTIEDGNENLDASNMVKTLADDQQKILSTLQNVFVAAQNANDEVTMDMIISRMESHQKNAWMLKSSL